MNLNTINPGVISFYYIILIIFALIFNNIYYLISLLIFIIVLIYLQGKKGEIATTLKYFIPMSLIIIILNPLFSNVGTTKIYIFSNYFITLESLVYGLLMAFSLLIILLLFLSFNEYVDYQKILYLSSNHFPTVSMIGVMAMRFIPLLNYRLGEVNKIFNFNYDNLALNDTNNYDRINSCNNNTNMYNNGHNKIIRNRKIRNKINKVSKMGSMLAIVISWSLEESMLTAKSMRARGYGITKRTSYLKYNINKIDIILILIIIGSSIISLIGLYYGFGNLKIYPTLNKSSFQFPLNIYYIIFLMLLSPFIILELIERIRWNFNG
ncbi:energy-coupling factor transporter transmembrane component T [Methanobrevibacter sp.]|uniref:energy-coupling factor transporter transmembrane component T n=1 Tax=Methanobrevibacter sp. TaxID=66852 RepID=UPI00261B9F80|nr:energy-coupling factor transporter transmembrane component T [uncultured Methanobrevibacter sp.]